METLECNGVDAALRRHNEAQTRELNQKKKEDKEKYKFLAFGCWETIELNFHRLVIFI